MNRPSPPLLASTFVVFASLLMGKPAFAAIKVGDEEQYLQLGGLLQAWAESVEDAAPNGTAADQEIYLRRIRLIFSGQLDARLNFFVDIDSPNLGKRGDWSGSVLVQDAYAEYVVGEALQLDAGMLLVPFSHHGMQGATSLLGLDYVGGLLRYPAGSNKTWRDMGFMARGLVLNQHLEYRVGLFNGVRGSATLRDVASPATGAPTASWQEVQDPRNPEDWPRLTARVAFNVFEAEGGAGVGGFFYDGSYLKESDDVLISPKTVLSIGASVDWQKDANARWAAAPTVLDAGTRAASTSDYVAFAADVFWDLPVDQARQMALNGQLNFYHYDHGDRGADAFSVYDGMPTAARLVSGNGVLGEVGFRVDKVQPVFQLGWYKATGTTDDRGDYLSMFGGFNYWLRGHAASLKLRVGSEKEHGARSVVSGALQAQLVF